MGKMSLYKYGDTTFTESAAEFGPRFEIPIAAPRSCSILIWMADLDIYLLNSCPCITQQSYGKAELK